MSEEHRQTDPSLEEFVKLMREEREWRREHMEDAIARGVSDGIKQMLKDNEVITQYWKRGFDEIISHGSNHTDRWIGQRIKITVIGFLLTAVIVWAVKSGVLK